MKTFFLLSILPIFISEYLPAQIMGGYSLPQNNFTLLVNNHIEHYGVYVYYNFGKVKIGDVSYNPKVYGAGLTYQHSNHWGRIMLGTSYIDYNWIDKESIVINPDKLKPYSLDVGAIFPFMDSDIIWSYFLSDLVNWSITMGFGISIDGLYKKAKSIKCF